MVRIRANALDGNGLTPAHGGFVRIFENGCPISNPAFEQGLTGIPARPGYRFKEMPKTQIQKQEQITTYSDANLLELTNSRIALPAPLLLATPAAILAALCSATKSSFAGAVVIGWKFRCALRSSLDRLDRLQVAQRSRWVGEKPVSGGGLRPRFARKGRSPALANRAGARLQAHARPGGRIRAAWLASCAPMPQWP